MSVTLIIGGCRSGKSSHAAMLALERSERPVYVATSRVWDADHAERIQRHRQARGPQWQTIEREAGLSQLDLDGRVAVVDCVTLWLTNLITDLDGDADRALDEAKADFDSAASRDVDWIFVSNELGQGLHAETALGRKFVDLQGFMNQHVAARAEEVTLMVAGIPLPVRARSTFSRPNR